MRGDWGAFLLVSMKLDKWDYLALTGLLLLAAGIWMAFGPGTMLIVLGVIFLLAGVGGAASPNMRR
jgi:hypothetical protein